MCACSGNVDDVVHALETALVQFNVKEALLSKGTSAAVLVSDQLRLSADMHMSCGSAFFGVACVVHRCGVVYTCMCACVRAANLLTCSSSQHCVPAGS